MQILHLADFYEISSGRYSRSAGKHSTCKQKKQIKKKKSTWVHTKMTMTIVSCLKSRGQNLLSYCKLCPKRTVQMEIQVFCSD